VLLLLLTAEGNGGKTDKYEWAQTLGELSITVPLPPSTKSRDIVCTISRKKLKAGIKGQPLIIDVSMLSMLRHYCDICESCVHLYQTQLLSANRYLLNYYEMFCLANLNLSRRNACEQATKCLYLCCFKTTLRMQGDLHKSVIVEDSFWTLEDGKELSIALQKDNKMEWWKCVIEGDAEIDTTKVQPENSKLDDLDADTRKTVEKMMVSACT
jgi:CS domain